MLTYEEEDIVLQCDSLLKTINSERRNEEIDVEEVEEPEENQILIKTHGKYILLTSKTSKMKFLKYEKELKDKMWKIL